MINMINIIKIKFFMLNIILWFKKYILTNKKNNANLILFNDKNELESW